MNTTAVATKLTKTQIRKFPKKDLDKATRHLFEICAQGFLDYTPGGNVGVISYNWAVGQLEKIVFEGFRVPVEPQPEPKVEVAPEPVAEPETLRAYNVLVNKLGRVTASARIPASEPQVRYISRLLNERDLGDLDGKVELAKVLIDQHGAGKLSKRSAGEIIDILLELPMREGAPVQERRRATEKQLENVIREGARRVFDNAEVQDTVDRATAGETVYFDEASRALDLLFVVPFRPREEVAPADEPEAGFYVMDGEVYKVVRAVHGSGRMYAKRLDKVTGEWERDRGAVAKIRPTHKMSLEQARETANVVARDVNGALYGRCFVCSTTLTDEKSIEIGMGPVCRDKF